MRILAKKLKTKAFDADLADGFVIDRVRDDFVHARFVERVEYDDTVTDPFGKDQVFHRIEYRQCEFRASKDGPGLELLNAPRGTNTMVSRLIEVSDFSLAISAVSIDVLAWAAAVQKNLNVRGIVDSLQVGDLALTAGVTAKAVLKGSTDVLDAATTLVAGRKHAVEKVQLTLAGASRSKMILTNVGVVKLGAEASEQTLNAVRKALVGLIAKPLPRATGTGR